MNQKELKRLLLPPHIPEHPLDLQDYITKQETSEGKLKPDNQARIIWHNTDLKTQTTYSIVYIHGFSASQGDGKPLHTELAEFLGANLFLARLSGHGLAQNPLENVQYQDWIRTTVEAIAIGQQIGERVIVMGCSTGAALACLIAAFQPSIAALMLYSPLVEFSDWRIRNFPVGLLHVISNWMIPQSRIKTMASKKGESAFENQYWYQDYPLKAVVELKKLVELFKQVQPFSQLRMPLFLGYYHKSKSESDHRVYIPALEALKEEQISPGSYRFIRNYIDGGYHILTNPWHNKAFSEVLSDSKQFLERFLTKH
jgi:esterase/lipase